MLTCSEDVFYRNDTKKVSTANKSRPKRPLPESLELAYAQVTCAHYGEKENRKSKQATGKRPNQR